MREITLGFAMCGSFCTFEAAMDQLRGLVKAGYQVIPIMSQNAYGTDTRFGRACDFVWEAEDICGRKVIHSIVGAEPLGPKNMVDALVIAPCTGNTLAKLACGVTDTPVTMAANPACASACRLFFVPPQTTLSPLRRRTSGVF